jgi:glutathione S-transferase
MSGKGIMAMNAVTLFGAPYSVYVRICRITLAEKGVRHTLEPVDVFSDDGVPPAHLQRNPFGRIPAFDHDGFGLFETDAIVHYIDDVFDGPPLQGDDPHLRARMCQIMRIADSELCTKGVWGAFVPWSREGTAADLEPVERSLAIIQDLAGSNLLTGDQVTLADPYVYATLRYVMMVPQAEDMLARLSGITSWYAAMMERESVTQSLYPAEQTGE